MFLYDSCFRIQVMSIWLVLRCHSTTTPLIYLVLGLARTNAILSSQLQLNLRLRLCCCSCCYCSCFRMDSVSIFLVIRDTMMSCS
uniref:Uncharacterized protein n=1 Tax=Rhizophora mucronata TaxID=61149 RepID=A0A2P2PJ89_RHIMU